MEDERFSLFIHPAGGFELFIKSESGYENYTADGYYGLVEFPSPPSHENDISYFESYPEEASPLESEAVAIYEILAEHGIFCEKLMPTNAAISRSS